MPTYRKGEGQFTFWGQHRKLLDKAILQNKEEIKSIETGSREEAAKDVVETGKLGAKRVMENTKPAKDLKPGEIGPVSGSSLAARKDLRHMGDKFAIDKSEGKRDKY